MTKLQMLREMDKHCWDMTPMSNQRIQKSKKIMMRWLVNSLMIFCCSRIQEIQMPKMKTEFNNLK